MHARVRRAYIESQIENSVSMAEPSELVVMVYERILEHAENARLALLAGQDPEEPVSKILDLIEMGLRSCLNHEVGGEISRNLENLYNWGASQLLRARLNRDPELVEDFQRVFSTLAEAWKVAK
jgi:flagellar protein FliS